MEIETVSVYGDAETEMESEEEVVMVGEPKEGFGGHVARIALLAVMFFTPLFYLPWTIPMGFGKETVILILVAIAFVGWLSNFLSFGLFSYKKNFLNTAAFLLLAVTAISTFFSTSMSMSLMGPDATGEKLVSLVVFVLAFFLVSTTFKKEDGLLVTFVIFSSFLLTGLLSLFQLWGFHLFPFSSGSGPDFNPIGTANNMAILYGMILACAIGILSHLKKVRHHGTMVDGYFKWVVSATAVVLFLNVIMVTLPRGYAINGIAFNSDFRLFWVAMGVAAIFLLSLSFMGGISERGSGRLPQRGISFYGPLFLIIFAVMLYFVRTPLFGTTFVNLPLEVSPSHQATYQIAKNVLSGHMFLGSGPATFLYDYSLWRDPSINLTNFWSVKFFHGSSYFLTLLATTGILGIVSLAIFILSSLLVLLRNVLRKTGEEDPILFGITAALVFGFVMWFLYSSSYTSSLVMFLLLGLFLSLAAREGERGSMFDVSKRTLMIVSPSALFISSLVAIFLMIASIAMMYYGVQKYVAESYYTKGVDAFTVGGNLDDAEKYFTSALAADSSNDKYLRNEAQVLFLKVRDTLARAIANPTQPIAPDFSAFLGRTIDTAKAATVANPNDIQNWTVLGNIYETVIPFIGNADKFAVDAYQSGTKFDPVNPAAFLDSGRARLAAIDLIQLRINQTKDQAQLADMNKQREDLLNGAASDLEMAIKLKSDYAPAHFLLAQVFVRKNDLAGAIRKLEDTKIMALSDVGVAFQLGVLYYTGGQFDKAQGEFERAIALSESYSNARYFLGLIYDRNGDKEKALQQFLRIGELNPGNQEVEHIIQNLKDGKAALADIVPPSPAPEVRKEPPVSDKAPAVQP